MYTFERSFFVNRPVEEVWAFVSEPSNHPKFSSAISAEWISEAPPDVGSEYRVVGRFLGRNVELESEITSWQPPHQYSSQTVNGPIATKSQWTFTTQDGGTLATLSGEAEIGGFFKIAESLVGKQIDKQMTSDLSGLKLMLEAD